MTDSQQEAMHQLKTVVKRIVDSTTEMVDSATSGWVVSPTWCCIFCQSDEEFAAWSELALEVGELAKDTHNGPVVVLPNPISAVAGAVQILKVRAYDPTRPERGDADFDVGDYDSFKARFLEEPGFSLIEKPDFQMIELMQEGADVRAYFSNPPVPEHAGIREALLRVNS